MVITSPIRKSWRSTSKDYIDRELTGLLAHLHLKGQGDNIGATKLFTPEVNATYRVVAYIIVTTVDGVSSTMPKVTIGWTDGDNSTAQTLDLTATSAGNALTTSKAGTALIQAKAGVDITYATSGYLSNTAHSMKYSVVLSLEIL